MRPDRQASGAAPPGPSGGTSLLNPLPGGPVPGPAVPLRRTLPRPRHSPRGTGSPWASGTGLAHLVTLAASLAFWAWTDRGLWFFGDEWDFLADRGLRYGVTSPSGIWYPHNEHWSTLPILLWRALFSVFHLTTYWPYLVPLLLVNLGVMHLAWRLCLREGADPWVSTAVVALLGFLGAGAEDLTWAFQVGFIGSVLFGLAALVLLGREGRPEHPRRHDLAVAALLVAGLMCSAAGIAMLAGAWVFLLAGRRFGQALRVAAGPSVIFVVWYAVVGHYGLSSHSDQLTLSTWTNLPNYVWSGLSGALGQTFNLPAAGGALLVGLGAWLVVRGRPLWAPRSMTVPLVSATVVFYVLAALGRDNTTVSSDVSRYIYVAIALLAPLLARALSPVRPASPVRWGAVVLVGVTLLGNVGQAETWETPRLATVTALKEEVLSTSYLLGHGVKDIAGPMGQPVAADPNLFAHRAAQMERDGAMPAVHFSAVQLVNARALLSVDLTPRPLVSGRFAVVSSARAVRAADGKGCTTFAPKVVNPPMEVRLEMAPGESTAAAEVITAPAPAGTTNYLAALLEPVGGPPGTVANQLEVAPKGVGYLSFDDPGAQVVLVWAAGTSLTLCGLATRS